jgi:hypothetical protein
MLVPSMTLQEIRKEINKDFPILFRKTIYVLQKLEKQLQKAEKKKGFTAFYNYCSKYKNQWIYRLNITKKQSLSTCMLLYHNGRGHIAIATTQNLNLIYHTPHFFERYNERLQLGLKTQNEIYQSYMNETPTYKFQNLEEISPGIFTMFCVIDSGIILGIHNEPLKMIKANTFLTHDMLRKDQRELMAVLKNESFKYIPSAGNLY